MIKAFSSFSDHFVSPLYPERGEETEFSIVFEERPDSVLLRADSDSGLVCTYPMAESGIFNGAFKYSGKAPVTSTEGLFRYFFVFFHHGASWYYSRRGVTRSTPKISDRFSLIPSLDTPSWVPGSTCYQIFPDRFFRGNPLLGAKAGEYSFDGGIVTTPSFGDVPRSYDEARCLDFYNGDLDGIIMKIPYLKTLGITAVYLNPINDSRTVHRYDSADFFHVDPKLGGDEAFRRLMDAMHDNGIRVIVDISINHTGTESAWFKKALSDASSEERGYYYFDGGGARCWQGVRTLPQLNYNSEQLRDKVYRSPESAMQKFLRAPFMQDGWRLDVAPELGRTEHDQLTYEVWREVRKSLKTVRKDLYLVGEDWDDSILYMQGDMWDATMNYYGVSRPVRSWMGERDRFLTGGWGHAPESEEGWNGYEMAEALTDAIASVPDQSAFFQMNLFDSHDTPRLHNNAAVFNKSIYAGVVITSFFLPGMPSVYYGDEILLDGRMGSVEGARYPMCWDESAWDMDTMEVYRSMAMLRKEDFFPLSACRIEAVDRDAFVIERISSGKAAAAIVNKSPERRKVSVSLFAMPHNAADIWYGEGEASIHDGMLEVVLEKESSAVVILS